MDPEEEQRRIEREAHEMDVQLLKRLPEKCQKLFGDAEAAMNKQGREGEVTVSARVLRGTMIYLARQLNQMEAVTSALDAIGVKGCREGEEHERLREWMKKVLERTLSKIHPLTACADEIADALVQLKNPSTEEGEKKD